MSASGAAPLPRLGEVFFDVRGDSRSMRLSWYADTGVAVFSIWQGGMCTGTFRLPIDDLGRMIEILRRGPQAKGSRRRSAPDDRRGGRDQAPAGYGGADAEATQFSLEAVPDAAPYGQPAAAAPARGLPGPGYDPPGYEPGGYGTGGYQAGGRDGGGHEAGSYETGGHEAGGFETGAHGTGGYGTGAYGTGAYGTGGSGTGGYDPLTSGRHGARLNEEYPAAEYAERDLPAGSYWPDDGGYQPDATGQQGFPEPGAAAYGQDRFVPPYVRPTAGSYPNDNPGGSPDRGGRRDRDAYPGDRRPPAYPVEDYPPSQRPAGGYFDRPDYQLTAEPAATPRHSAGRHSSQHAPAEQGERDLPPAGNREAEPDYRGRASR